MSAPTAASQIALVGVRVRLLTRCQNARAGQRAVPGERVDHPRVGGDRRHAAEQLGADHDQQQQLAPVVADRVDEDLGRRHAGRPSDRAGVVLDGERDADQQHPAGDQRDHDRHHDAARAGGGGVVRLLGHVRRGVVAGERVLRQQQADQDDVERRRASPVSLTKCPNTKLADWWCDGHEGQHADDDQHAEDVPPHADVVQQRDQPDAELVQQAVHEQHDRVDQRPCTQAPRSKSERQVEERVDEERGAEVDARGHRDLAEEVEPAGEPGPGGRRCCGASLAAQ